MKGGESLGELKYFDSTARLSEFSIINSEFTLARCRIMYTGRNRNRTDITEDALNKLITRKGYANIPVVAHLYKGDDGNWRVGGHDSKIIATDSSFEIIDETVPFGVIPEDCNPAFEDVTEKSGEVKRYFCVDIILWTHRYNIMDAVKSDELWFNQSMEIIVNHCDYDAENYCVIDDFSLSALCLLNHDPYNKENEVEPCFPSAAVVKFELDKLKREFEALYEKLKIFERGGINLNIEQLKKSLDSKYFMLSAAEDSVVAMTKENFEVFKIPYTVSADKADIAFDYAKAVKKYIAVSDSDTGIDTGAIKGYVDDVKADIVAGMDKTYSQKYEAEKAAAVKELAGKLVEANAQIGALQAEREKDAKIIEGYQAAERQAAESKHRAEIDDIVAKYSDRFYDVPDLFVYKSNLDYSKTPEQVEQDIYVILGKQASNTGGITGKANFSAASWDARGGLESPGRGSNGRYGDLFDKFDV